MTTSAFMLQARSWPGSPDTSDLDLVSALGDVPKTVPREDWPSIVPEIAALLHRTASAKIRNAAALALADMQFEGAARSISAVLSRPEIAPAAGTLLYALDELGAPVPLNVVLNIVAYGSYEARAEVIILLQKGRAEPFDAAAGHAAKERLAVSARSENEEEAEAAELAIDLLRLS